MFQFNGELFINACEKMKNANMQLSLKESVIVQINNLSFDYEYKPVVAEICKDINTVTQNIEMLLKTSNNVKQILNILDDDMFNLDDQTVFGEILSTNLNALDFLNSGQYGANQSGPILLLRKAAEDYDLLTDVEKKQYNDLLKVFEKYKYLTKEGNWNSSMYKFMQTAQTSGCGFAANTNVIIGIYSNMENGEENFKEKYGFRYIMRIQMERKNIVMMHYLQVII